MEIITKHKAGIWSVNNPTKETQHFGLVELCVLASLKLPSYAKLLFIYYRAATSTFGYCTRSSETIYKSLGIGNKTYNKAKSKLLELGLIRVEKRGGYGLQITDKVETKILPPVDDEMEWPESWKNSMKKEAMKSEPPEITRVSTLEALGLKQDNLTPPDRIKEHMPLGHPSITNNNLSKSHNNNNLSLIANTTGSEDPDMRTSKIKIEKFDSKLFAEGFYIDELDQYHETIKKIFITIRNVTGHYEWRINNEDYFQLSIFCHEHYHPEYFESVVAYIAKHRPNANSLSYFLSLIKINTTICSFDGSTEEFRDRSDRYEEMEGLKEFLLEKANYKALRIAQDRITMEAKKKMAPVAYEANEIEEQWNI
ncbi:hypothetical protein [Draconibacterium orientale]|jgi:hypothetical protein|uniref:hypothetical protein n=1 Tax=Draconibacterium orientale TaxID=1168034 RepID=UPI002A0A9E03|nr:hypothetical protein [Draconibacterium orientale]